MSDSGENVSEIELESLEAIYINELTYTRNSDATINQIELLLHPSTGHDLTKQYVCMTLVFTLTPAYPNDPPEIEIRNPRGLGEEEISSLVEDMILKAENMRGDAMLYTLIEMAKDSLTEGNVPHCPCVVCLEHFDNPVNFHRTACYHYFHTHCLHKYLLHTVLQMEEDDRDASERRHLDVGIYDKNKAKKIMCPVCRAPLDEKSVSVTCSPDALADDEKAEVFVVPDSLREQQLKMSQLYEHQKAKGGIIDLELEKNKYLVNPEDRWPIPGALVTPAVTSQDTPRNLSAKHDPGSRREDRHKQHRGRGNFHHGRSDRDWYGPSKGRHVPKARAVGRTENIDRHPSGGFTRGPKDMTEGVDRQSSGGFTRGPKDRTEDTDRQPLGGSTRGLKDRTEDIDRQPLGGSTRGLKDRTEDMDRQPSGGSTRGPKDRTEDIDRQPLGGSTRGTKDRTEGADRFPSGGSTRGTKARTEKELKREQEISEAKEATFDTERGQERAESTKKDHVGSRNGKIDREDSGFRTRGAQGSYEKSRQEEDGLGKDSRGDNFEHDRLQKVNDVSSGRGRGMYAPRPGRRYNVKEDDGHYNYRVSETESESRREKPARLEETNAGSKERQPSNIGSGRNINEKQIDGAEGKLLEGKENVAQSERCLTSSIKDEGASGCDQTSDRGINSRLGGYDREHKGGERGARHYGRKESGGYKAGGGQRGTGSESGYKESKFNDRRGGHTESPRQPHARYDRPQQQRSSQYHHQQHNYHHNRHEEERERVSRPKRDDTETRVREENTSDSRTVVRDVNGAGTSSETVAQDEEEEEADCRHSSGSPPWQNSTAVRSLTGTGVNMMTNQDSSCPQRLNLHGRNNDIDVTSNSQYLYKSNYTQKTSRPECNVSQKLNKKCQDKPSSTTDSLSMQNHNGNNDDGMKNCDCKCHLESAVSYESTVERNNDKFRRSQHNIQINMKNNHRGKSNFHTYRTSNQDSNYIIDGNNCLDAQYDSQKPNDSSSNSTHSCLAYNTNTLDLNYGDDNETWDDEIDIYDFERCKIRPERLEDYDRQVAPRNKQVEDKLKERAIIESEFRRIRNESLRIGNMQKTELHKEEKSEDLFQGKSVLELFKESQASQREDDNSGNDNSCTGLGVTDGFVVKMDDGVKSLGNDISAANEFGDCANVSDAGHKKFCDWHHQTVDGALGVVGAKNRPDLGISSQNAALARKVKRELVDTDGYCRQFDRTWTEESDNCFQGHSRVDLRQGHSRADSRQGHSRVDSRQGHSRVDSRQGHSRVDSRQGHSRVDSRQGHSRVDSRQGHSGVDSRQGHSRVDSRRGHTGLDSRQGHSGLDSRQGHSGLDSRRGHSGVDYRQGQLTQGSNQALQLCQLTQGSNQALQLCQLTQGSNQALQQCQLTQGSNQALQQCQLTQGSNQALQLCQLTQGSNQALQQCQLTQGSNQALQQCQLTKDSISITEFVPSNAFNPTTSSSHSSATEDEYLSFNSESLHRSSVPLHTITNWPLLYADSFVSPKVSPETIDKVDESVEKSKPNDKSPSFNACFKKAPPLDFSKRRPKSSCNNSSLCSVPKTTAVNEELPTGETPICSSSPQGLEQVVGAKWSLDMNELCNLYSLPLETTLCKLSTQSTASVPDLSAALLNSYRTSCLISASLLSNCQTGFGVDPALLTLLGNTDDMNNLCTLNYQEAHNNVNKIAADAYSQKPANSTEWHLVKGQVPTDGVDQ